MLGYVGYTEVRHDGEEGEEVGGRNMGDRWRSRAQREYVDGRRGTMVMLRGMGDVDDGEGMSVKRWDGDREGGRDAMRTGRWCGRRVHEGREGEGGVVVVKRDQRRSRAIAVRGKTTRTASAMEARTRCDGVGRDREGAR